MRSAGPSSSTSRPNGTRSAAAIAHSVSTLGLPLPDSSCASVDLPSPASAARSASVETGLLPEPADVRRDGADEEFYFIGQSSIPVAPCPS